MWYRFTRVSIPPPSALYLRLIETDTVGLMPWSRIVFTSDEHRDQVRDSFAQQLFASPSQLEYLVTNKEMNKTHR